MLCDGKVPAGNEIDPTQMIGSDWPDDLPIIVYADPYGNLMTGLRAASLDRNAILAVAGRELCYARTFCEVPAGAAFWNENSFGLVELAVNKGAASSVLGLVPGDAVTIKGRA
jgi:S-adenosylmethionine hydrolase